VPMWFTMYLMTALSFFWSLRALRRQDYAADLRAKDAAEVGTLFGILGLATGIVWSRVTWGRLMRDSNPAAWWSWDPKQTAALLAVLMFAAYFVLRNSVPDPAKRLRLAGVYNIFAVVSLFPLTFVVPRMVDSLHPGGDEGNPLFPKDVSAEYRIVFYPSIVGFFCLALWMWDLRSRASILRLRLTERDFAATLRP
ncbi:MAG: cytochrome c biogenesis protein CcsA, partial [Bacteroidia bacterium]|nr:cytochrome c biogenesis protein CcsA [Bacteroidia bacterium]